ncbi:MAG: wax ester/triacylglycerol synthase family O-acyltransferase [Microthrixaceae bacterium]
MNRWWKLAIGVLGTPLLLSALLTAAWAVAGPADKASAVAPNVSIAGEPVGGMGQAALDRTIDSIAKRFTTTPVRIDAGDFSLDTTAAALGVTVDTEQTAARAMALGRHDPGPLGPVRWIKSYVNDRRVRVALTVDGAKATATLAKLEGKRHVDPVEPTMRNDETGFSLVKGRSGTSLDAGRIIDDIPLAIGRIGQRIDIDAPLQTIEPTLSDAAAKAVVDQANAATGKPLVLHFGDQKLELDAAVLRKGFRMEVHGATAKLTLDTDYIGKVLLDRTGVSSNPTGVRMDLVNGVPTPVPGHDAAICCDAKAPAQIVDALLANRHEVTLGTNTITAAQGVEWARSLGIKEVIGQFTTRHGCCAPRVKNIHRMSDLTRCDHRARCDLLGQRVRRPPYQGEGFRLRAGHRGGQVLRGRGRWSEPVGDDHLQRRLLRRPRHPRAQGTLDLHQPLPLRPRGDPRLPERRPEDPQQHALRRHDLAHLHGDDDHRSDVVHPLGRGHPVGDQQDLGVWQRRRHEDPPLRGRSHRHRQVPCRLQLQSSQARVAAPRGAGVRAGRSSGRCGAAPAPTIATTVRRRRRRGRRGRTALRAPHERERSAHVVDREGPCAPIDDHRGLPVRPDDPRDVLLHRFERLTRVIPRLRQRVRANPYSAAPPRWEIDPNFDLHFHLWWVRAPGRATMADLMSIAEPVAMSGFDRARPLWRVVVVEGLPNKQSAMVLKVHHSITDGMGGVRLQLELLDLEADAPERDMPDAPEVHVLSQPERFADALGHQTRTQLGLLRDLASGAVGTALSAVANPVATVNAGAELVGSVGRVLRPTSHPLSPLMTARSLSVHFDTLTVPMAPMKAAAKKAGGRLNDAFVGGIARGLYRYHLAHGIDIDELRMSIPINIRTKEKMGVAGNAFVPARIEIPVDTPDPIQTMKVVRTLVDEARHEPANDLVEPVAGLLNRLPATATTAIFGSMVKAVDFTASNVPGPPVPMYLAGAKLLAQFPFGPLAGTALNITLLSYCTDLNIGIAADPAAVPDMALLTNSLREGFDEIMAV